MTRDLETVAADVLARTEEQQSRASNPTASAWVSANAGAGKTHVLMMRVLRLLLAGTPPERILCLTFTKAAAAEMSNRVFDRLARWSTSPDPDLEKDLAKLLDRHPTRDDMSQARRMFAHAIETPGGLKVQTIHAFCERVLQRFPLEAEIPPGFSILDDETAASLKREAIDQTLAEATRETTPPELSTALERAVRWAADDRFDLILSTALEHRAWLREQAALDPIHGEDAFQRLDVHYRHLLAVRRDITTAEIEREMASVLGDAQIRAAAALLADGGKNDQSRSTELHAAARATTDAARTAVFKSVFLTAKGEPRADKTFVSKAKREEDPGLAATLAAARDTFHALSHEATALHAVEATLGLIRLASLVMQRYHDAKARRAALDYDDLIEAAGRLLSAGSSPQWFHFKLDGGLDHILVDEAQDTSPEQWNVIRGLADEFYSDMGARDTLRTLFAVGDEKQSIYSFQGAAPEKFAGEGSRFRSAAQHRQHPWCDVPLELSFRTVTPILDAVDTVFADPACTPGLTGGTTQTVRHIAWRTGQAGLVEIWEPEHKDKVPATPAFAPLDDETPTNPASDLAARIADTIGDWLSNGEPLVSQGRPVRPGDIMILVRKRQPFADVMVRALKERKIPVAGSDQLVLANQIAIQDLMALGDFLTLPEDDLSLAVVLKSPLFGLDDNDLLGFAPERKGSLWSALLAAATGDPRLGATAEKLKRLRALADFTPPFEFYAALLEHDGARRRFLERLGPDAADAIDEFMNLALAFDDQAAVSLQGFLSWLREGDRKVKRDMKQARNEVRVMTVHGAKGLEAPIVFLPDTCSSPTSGGNRTPLVELEEDDGRSTQVWSISGSGSLPVIERSRTARTAREIEEHNRLLYVAMTRAKDRLYVGGFQNSAKRRQHCWYDTIHEAIGDKLVETSDSAGRKIWRMTSLQETPPKPDKDDEAETATTPETPPEWARTRAPSIPQLSIPLAPSRLAPLETDETGEPAAFEDVRARSEPASEGPSPSPAQIGSQNRFLRGTLTHALLEHLPRLPADTWETTATEFVEARAAALPTRVRASIVSETLDVLRDPAFRDVFGAASRAEVPIVAEITPPETAQRPIRLSGQIDRLVVRDHDILILDYKTNRPPPTEAASVADAYVLQLAAYRLAIKKIYPGRSIQAAILWTDGCRLMPIPEDLLEACENRLWTLRTAPLDAD